MSEVSMAAFCGCVSCGLWVPLMWSVCGHVLRWTLRPFAGVYWLVGVVEGVYVSNEWSGHGSFMGVSLIVWVPLMWSVCGRGLPLALRLLSSVYWPGGSV